MTVYCPTAPTLISINGDDYIQYPVGTDVEVLPVSLTYSFLWAATRYNGSFNDCSRWANYLRFYRPNNTTCTITVSDPSLLNVQTMVNTLGGNQWTIDNCKPLGNNETGFSFQTGYFYPISCGGEESQVSVRYNGIEQFTAGQQHNAIGSVTVSAYRLKIITP